MPFTTSQSCRVTACQAHVTSLPHASTAAGEERQQPPAGTSRSPPSLATDAHGESGTGRPPRLGVRALNHRESQLRARTSNSKCTQVPLFSRRLLRDLGGYKTTHLDGLRDNKSCWNRLLGDSNPSSASRIRTPRHQPSFECWPPSHSHSQFWVPARSAGQVLVSTRSVTQVSTPPHQQNHHQVCRM